MVVLYRKVLEGFRWPLRGPSAGGLQLCNRCRWFGRAGPFKARSCRSPGSLGRSTSSDSPLWGRLPKVGHARPGYGLGSTRNGLEDSIQRCGPARHPPPHTDGRRKATKVGSAFWKASSWAADSVPICRGQTRLWRDEMRCRALAGPRFGEISSMSVVSHVEGPSVLVHFELSTWRLSQG